MFCSFRALRVLAGRSRGDPWRGGGEAQHLGEPGLGGRRDGHTSAGVGPSETWTGQSSQVLAAWHGELVAECTA